MATCAASASLSPNAISSVAVASFSFTIGTAPSAKSASSALRAFTYAARSATSAAVSRICAAWIPSRASARSHACCRRACPSAEAACSFGTARGRRSRPRCGRPSAMAPDDTTTTASPPATIAAISRARRRRTVRRTEPRGPATRLVPSLTTRVTDARCRRRRRGTGEARGRGTSPAPAARAPSRR